MSVGTVPTTGRTTRILKQSFKAARKIALFGLAAYFIPEVTAFFVACGTLDVLRNSRRTWSTIDRYFAGNGFFTLILSPFNLLMDLLSLPYWNKGIYKIEDLPKTHQEEINTIIEAALKQDLVGKLESKMEGQKRGMIFFKWYGKNIDNTLEIPEFHQQFKYIRTIGVSVFNKKQSTGKHYGPLRITLRVLYNINDMKDKTAFIKVGNHTNYWQDNKLFIFDDTLQHQSCNNSDAVRYCMFLDILRPTPVPAVTSAILSCIRVVMAPFNWIFYGHWTFLK
ncbi:MAG TPA: aspartyl/asparaginyl beta-hydroxylase domain-containing protein [Gemmataceae bacterium]|nr:aspartyl/asparaginyl beta-hydroxylase domain-containing protein [Gemmataceae bacterium]